MLFKVSSWWNLQFAKSDFSISILLWYFLINTVFKPATVLISTSIPIPITRCRGFKVASLASVNPQESCWGQTLTQTICTRLMFKTIIAYFPMRTGWVFFTIELQDTAFISNLHRKFIICIFLNSKYKVSMI